MIGPVTGGDYTRYYSVIARRSKTDEAISGYRAEITYPQPAPTDRQNVINSAHLKRRRFVLMKKLVKFIFYAPPFGLFS